MITAIMLTGCAALTGPLFMEDPLSAQEHNNLGVIYEREGKYELALREYSQAIESDPGLVTPLVNTANVYYGLGEYTNAEKFYKKALSKDERNLEAANNLASLYIETGEGYDEALGYILRATEGAETIPPYALDTMGVLYIKTGDTEQGRSLLLRACGSDKVQEATLEQVKIHLAQIGETCGNTK
jgi:tetratricopeptide (TPR) repeat protein